MNEKINNNEHPYVDLGLPSGTLWATMNVGASKSSDAGLYFQWGDTSGFTADQVGNGEGKKPFKWTDYKFNPSGDGKTFTKYTTTGATLELEDDAAHVNMGGDWHMPTPSQIKELVDNTINTWTTQDGVNGRLFTSKTDTSKSVFIPAVGYAWGDSLGSVGGEAGVWTSTLDTFDVDYGQDLDFDSSIFYLSSTYRNLGFSVRGVIG